MSFLTPLYIAGLALVSLPVLFHLIRRTPRGRQVFSSVMFLDPSPPRITRRNRLDHWPLLLLRALALCLLAAAFTRPFFREALGTASSAPAGRQLAVLLDTSASMRRGDLWRQAVAQAETIVRDCSPADSIGLFTFDRDLQALISFDEWNALAPDARRTLVQQRLQSTTPGWAGTDLGGALVETIQRLETENTAGTRADRLTESTEILLISDLQSGSELNALNDFPWPASVRLSVRAVKAAKTTNAGIQWVADSEAPADSPLRVRVTNAADSTQEQFRIHWAAGGQAEAEQAPVEVYVPPGRSRVVRLPEMPAASTQPHVVLEGDDHPFDNTAYVARRRPEVVTVVYFGEEAADDPAEPRYYIERAFPETADRRVSVLTQPAEAPLLAPDTGDVRLVVVGGMVSDEQARSLVRYVESGGTLLWLARAADDCRTFGKLAGQAELASQEADVDGYAMLTDVDFTHPAFAPFAETEFADFTRIHVWRHRRVDDTESSAVRVLARFDDGSPAVMEGRIGRGRAILFTFGWHPADSQLAVSSKFAPLMNGLLDLGRPPVPDATHLVVGDPIPISTTPGDDETEITVERPDRSGVRLASGETVFAQTVIPGVYTVSEADRAQQFAVNLPPDESKTSPLPAERLEAFGIRLAAASDRESSQEHSQRERQLQAVELEQQQKIWRWLILAALSVLFVETWLAGRMTHARPVTQEAEE